ncbi:hypothetical protein AYJ57_11705 [Salipiger sp. CCB-MM3]|uniref:hypothetical protein n=1 Tax=Salipiger sp. CCB-MM3 TaxID=1792508 RepID=UPI00080A9FCB|nr:hypothetical protein [Salipiger sp. CCB-MM3]ANT60968.1 hypothetical protein AYJ57_11705 [Salipiger sp. CCB-MM3]
MSAFVTTNRTVLLLQLALGLVERGRGFTRRTRVERTSPDDARARREFIWEMMSRNPDAFSSDADVQSMMGMYPGRF